MYRVFIGFVFVGFMSVYSQNVLSPCPEYFDYISNGTYVHGLITFRSFGPVSFLKIKVSFTVAAKLKSKKLGNITPISPELNHIRKLKVNVPLKYQLNFPVTSPLPKITSIEVNGNEICKGTGDTLDDADYITTITLQHQASIDLSNGIDDDADGPKIITKLPEIQVPELTSGLTYDEYRKVVSKFFELNPTFGNRYIADLNRTTDSSTTSTTTTTTTQRTTTTSTTETPRPIKKSNNTEMLNSMECGLTLNDIVSLIYKGETFERGDWPWLVAIYTKQLNTLKYICAGTLVSDRHVITAAHCMQQKNSFTAVTNLIVKAGVFDLDDPGDDFAVMRKISSAKIHEAYNASTLENDILVLTLSRSVPLDLYIKPACLWSGNTDLNRIVGQYGAVTGWGSNEFNEGAKGEPRVVRMPVVSSSTCRASRPEFHRLTSSRTLCAGNRNGSGPCVGDSGGGLYIHDDGRWKLRGIVSLSLLPDSGEVLCNLDEYVVFTDTAQYLPWIAKAMSNSII